MQAQAVSPEGSSEGFWCVDSHPLQKYNIFTKHIHIHSFIVMKVYFVIFAIINEKTEMNLLISPRSFRELLGQVEHLGILNVKNSAISCSETAERRRVHVSYRSGKE